MAMQSGFIKRIRDIMRMDAGINGDAQRIEQMVWMLFLKVYDAKEDDWELNEDNYTSIIPDECRWRNWAQADDNGHAMTGDKLLNFVNNTLFPTLKELPVTPDTPVKKAIVKSTFEDANNYMKDGVYLRQVIDIIDEIEFDDVKESHAFGFVYEEILRDLQAALSGEFYTPRAVTDFMALMIQPKLGEKMADFACGTGGFITSWLGQLQKQVKDTVAQKQFDDSIYGIEKKPFPYLLCVTNMLLHDIEVPNIYHMNSLKHNLLDYTDDDKFDVILMNPPYGGHEDKSIQGFFPDDLASSETADLFMSVIMYRLKKNGRAAVVVPDGFLFGLDNAKVAIKTKLLTEYNLHTVIRLPGSVFSPYTSISTNLLFFDNKAPSGDVWFYRVDMPSDRKHFSKTKPMELKHFDDAIAWWNDRKEIELEDGPKAKKYTTEFLLNDQGCNIDLCGYPHEEEEVLDPLDTIRNYQEKRTTLNAEIDKVLAELEALLPGRCYRMTPEQLKSSILLMAIQGKIVEQREEEGSGEDLYNLIQKEKQELISTGDVKQTTLDTITDEEIPFDIPSSWKWVRHNDLFEIVGGSQPPKSNFKDKPDEGDVRLYQIRDYGDTPVPVYVDKNLVSKFTEDGDILLARYGGSLGKVFWAKEGAYNVAMAKIVMLYKTELVDKSYLYYYYLAPLYQNLVKGSNRAAQGGFNKEDLNALMFPLPPLEEQHRIVKKIEETFPYVDRYAEAYEKLEQFNAKFPEDMKKSILQYAIQGKLVEQRPEEGTAEELYQQIQDEKQKLIKAGKIKKEKPLAEITEDEIPFDIPDSWKWVHLNNIASSGLGKTLNKSTDTGEEVPYLCSINVYWEGINLDKVKTAKFDDQAKEKYKLQKGDLLICEGGEAGRSAIWDSDEEMYYQNALHRVRFYGNVDAQYMCYVLECYKKNGTIANYTKGIGIQHLVQASLNSIWLPLPPLEEQQRIVSKVKELLPYCEQLVK